MMRRPASLPRLPFDLRTLFGIGRPDVRNWDKVHRARVAELQRMLPVILTVNQFNAIALVAMLWGSLPAWHALAWLAALTAVLGWGALALRRGTRADGTGGTRRYGTSMVGPATRGLALGLVWAVPALLFAPNEGLSQQLAICLILSGMIASAPVTLTALPVAMAGVILPIAAGMTVMMADIGSPILIALPPVYALSLLAAGVATARVSLRRHCAEAALHEEAGVVSLLLHEFEESGADWLWEIDVRKRLVSVHPRLARAFGKPHDALCGQPLIAMLAADRPADEPPAELRALLDLLDSRQAFGDHCLPVTIAGERRWWRLSAVPRHGADGAFCGFQGVASDVTEQRDALERIDRLARADSLTDLNNRMGFTERLRDAVADAAAGGPPCALVLVDLDRFKAVNDTYGHPIGDRLLRAAARRIARLAGPGDACGRLGGDEFAMLIADAGDQGRIDTLCHRLRQALVQGFEIDGHLLEVGASIGTALAPAHGESVDMLMRNADLALYRAKRDGRGTHQHFVPDLLRQVERRRAIEQGLRHALERDELRVAYQPVVAVPDGTLMAFEALLRWHNPDFGDVSPHEFVPIAGNARLMGMIGDWVLQTACREAARWPETVRLSINLAAVQALDARLPLTVRAALALSSLDPGRLQFEISESALLTGGTALLDAIDRIRETGVGLALDDFSTGFSYIRHARFGTIKLAPAFLQDMDRTEPEQLAMVRALVNMADALGVVTIAKGAETGGQQALAMRLGCRQVQGHASGPPLSAEAAALLAGEQIVPERRVA